MTTPLAPALLQVYLEQALLLGLAWVIFWAAWRSSIRFDRVPPSATRWRRGALLVITAALLLPPAVRLVPRRPGGPPLRSSAPPQDLAPAGARTAVWTARAALSIPQPHYRWRLSAAGESAALVLLCLAAAGATVGLAKRRREQRRLVTMLQELPLMRRHHRVSLCASDVAPVPFAARAAGRAWVVVPTDLLEDAPSLRLLVAHELQHHRQRDLLHLALIDTVRRLFFWNPAMAGWMRLWVELQELSCDEAVMERRRGLPRPYARLLVHVAAMEGRVRYLPGGVTAASGGSAGLLRRRIAMLMSRDRDGAAPRTARGGMLAAALCVVILAAAAVGARSAVLEKTLEGREVSQLADKLGRQGLPAPVNDVLLAEVQRWVAAPKERAFLRDARRRLNDRRAMVESALARHEVPAALAAVAIVESGFANLEPKANVKGAGVWQFIPETARLMGLRVDAEHDERLDVARQTDAAARYLAALHKRFGDWPLALAAYNEGGQRVQRAIEQGGTRDAWELMRSGRIGRYAATVMAAAVVLQGDESVIE